MKRLIFLITAMTFALAFAVNEPVRSANAPPGNFVTIQHDFSIEMPVAVQAVDAILIQITPVCLYQFAYVDISPGKAESFQTDISYTNEAVIGNYLLPDIRLLTCISYQTSFNKNLNYSEKTLGPIVPFVNNSSCKSNRCRAV